MKYIQYFIRASVLLVALLLLQSCESFSGGGSDDDINEIKKELEDLGITVSLLSEAEIKRLVLDVDGSEQTVKFDYSGDASGDVTSSASYLFGESVPASVTVKRVILSVGATSDTTNDATVAVENNKATITVTSYDESTERLHTIEFVEAPPSSATEVEQLILSISGVERTVSSFDASGDATSFFTYGGSAPASVTVESLTLAVGAIATIGSGSNSATIGQKTSLTVSNDQITFVVTAQDGETKQNYTIKLIEGANTEAKIKSMSITIAGQTNPVTFVGTSGSVYYPYGDGVAVPQTVKIDSISLSDHATYDSTSDNLTVTKQGNKDQVTLIVTAQDGKTQSTYTIELLRDKNTLAEIESLTVSILDAHKTVSFNASRDATIDYQNGAGVPGTILVENIKVSDNASYNPTQFISVSTATATIDVTSEDGQTSNTYTIRFKEAKPSLRNILDSNLTPGNSQVPTDLTSYDKVTQAVLAPYTAGATLSAKYVTTSGAVSNNGGPWSNATPSSQLKAILDNINDASSSKVYLILVASGTYDVGTSMTMKNNVAIVGGWDASSAWNRDGSTILSGGDSHRIFDNNFANSSSGIDSTSLLYDLTIANGKATGGATDGKGYGGGIRNYNASPTITNVIFSHNHATLRGGGMYNQDSSPVLTDVTFSDNRADPDAGQFFGSPEGGAVYNHSSSPTFTNVTFSGNSASIGGIGGGIGGGVASALSTLTFTNVTFSSNFSDHTSIGGGGIYGFISNHNMINVTFFDNSTSGNGGAIYLNRGSATMTNSIFWHNSSRDKFSGDQFYNKSGTMTIAYSVIQVKSGEFNDEGSATTIKTNLVNEDPNLADLSIDEGSLVATHAIDMSSSAKDSGVYVRSDGNRFYYSIDNNNWYTDFDGNGLINSVGLPANSVNPIATDATGTVRSNRPDVGAFEAR